MNVTALSQKKFYGFDLRLLDAVVYLIYVGIVLYVLPYHEPWGDEVQPWLMARDMSFTELAQAMFNNYDRHPGLWYFVMHFIAKLGFDISGASYANLLFCVSAVGLFLWKAPFPRWFKYPYMFSYYMLYEYPILARHYSLTILLITCVACLYAERHTKPILFSVFVFFLFNSAYITLGFTFAIMSCYLFEFTRQEKTRISALVALFIMLAGFVLVFVQGGILPPNHIDYGVPRFSNYYSENYFLAKALFAHPGQLSPAIDMVITTLIAAVLILTLLQFPLCLFMLISGYTLLVYIFKFHHWGDLRHYGFFLQISLFCLWVRPAYENTLRLTLSRLPVKKLQNIVLAACALIFLSGITFNQAIIKMEVKSFFSGGKWMAEQIDQMYDHFNLHDQDIVFVASPQNRVISVITHLPGKTFWIPGLNRNATYHINTKEVDEAAKMTDIEILHSLEENFSDYSKVFLLMGRPLTVTETSQARYHLLIDMTPVPVHGYVQEKFYLYKPVAK